MKKLKVKVPGSPPFEVDPEDCDLIDGNLINSVRPLATGGKKKKKKSLKLNEKQVSSVPVFPVPSGENHGDFIPAVKR